MAAVSVFLLSGCRQGKTETGVAVDHMGKESHMAYEDEMVRIGKLTEQERENRRLLRRIMREAGFRPLPTEWWHFNYCSSAEARSRCKCID